MTWGERLRSAGVPPAFWEKEAHIWEKEAGETPALPARLSQSPCQAVDACPPPQNARVASP